jgi:putative transposase
MLKAHKTRVYLTDAQAQYVEMSFGASRWYWNWLVTNFKMNVKQYLSFGHLEEVDGFRVHKYGWYQKTEKQLKESGRGFLKNVDSNSLQQVARAFTQANKMRKQASFGMMKYHSKKGKQSYKLASKVAIKNTYKTLSVGKLKNIKLAEEPRFQGVIKQAIFSKSKSGKYFVSMLIETEHKQYEPSENQAGIDVGTADLATLSNGVKYASIRIYRENEKKIARLQRSLARKHKGSKNREKAKKKLAKFSEHLANKRLDYLHKVTTDIVKKYGVIVVENLQTQNMMKNHYLAKSIQDQAWYEFFRQLEYKSNWNGRVFAKVNPYNTSKMCSECGSLHEGKMELSIREWDCPSCGAHHDRDINAAKNILTLGTRGVAY